jgi:hypothetical protein
MTTIRVKMNLRGLNALMRSAGAQEVVDQRGEAMARAAGENFEYVRSPHKWVARGFVQPKNARGMREEAIEKRLTRAIGAAR